jgi:hypothetical protein
VAISKWEPTLLLYAWIGEADKLQKQKMAFSRSKQIFPRQLLMPLVIGASALAVRRFTG